MKGEIEAMVEIMIADVGRWKNMVALTRRGAGISQNREE